MERQRPTRWLAGGVVGLAAVILLAPLAVGGGMGSGMWGPMHGGWMMDRTPTGASGWWLPFAGLWRLLALALAVLVGIGHLLYRAEEYERRRERLDDE